MSSLTLAGPAQAQAQHLFALLSSPLFGGEIQALILCRRNGQVMRQWVTKRGLMIRMGWSWKVRRHCSLQTSSFICPPISVFFHTYKPCLALLWRCGSYRVGLYTSVHYLQSYGKYTKLEHSKSRVHDK